MPAVKIQKKPVELRPDLTMWKIEGALDSDSIGYIHKEFDSVLETDQKFLIAEMSGVSVVSSAALGQLMGCRQMLVERGGDLVITGVNLDIKSKLSAMGATKIFKFYNEMRSAINAYHWEVERKSEKVWLSFPPELQFVPPVRQMVSRIARQKGYTPRDSFRIETIVDEVCNNAVEHGSLQTKKNIDITVTIDREKIELEVVNASDPDKMAHLKELSKSVSKTAPEVHLGERRGRGLALIKMLSNNLDINFSGEGTSVHVTKLREE
jgi:anti-sigma regulatory factor (Ser/Thr protein kinase)/anti-anti-sigma regulatory factor